MARTAVAAALLATAVSGATMSAGTALGVPTGPDDPECATMPEAVQCQGGPYSPPAPTGPADTRCISMPTDPVCAGGPYTIPSPPPPPPPPPPMAGMPGMPGTI
ncbi:hypothetical protein JDV09_04965 [Mycobacterium sp. Y57]|uniref:hypothetical protein n=1 Tax=Mycolicibacterium xanthum TaxID=2796469 RepID=UPI001C8638DB|nr:hypothetical protein [Mycolicibacterium xanthum]MBX7431463.1 hypothetical protein [Mycolicibacterium xanthum]